MIELMGHFTAIGMRITALPGFMVVNTCSDNDTAAIGDDERWSWASPTNRAVMHIYHDVVAVSTECLWQGCKILPGNDSGRPDQTILGGNWRGGKRKRPMGAYAGPGQPLITNVGAARRAVYLPAYMKQVEAWILVPEVRERVRRACAHPKGVLLRDFDTGRGIDQNRPMSHAWLLATWLNYYREHGELPTNLG